VQTNVSEEDSASMFRAEKIIGFSTASFSPPFGIRIFVNVFTFQFFILGISLLSAVRVTPAAH
jgi:hypothetical protein